MKRHRLESMYAGTSRDCASVAGFGECTSSGAHPWMVGHPIQLALGQAGRRVGAMRASLVPPPRINLVRYQRRAGLECRRLGPDRSPERSGSEAAIDVTVTTTPSGRR